MCVSPCVLTPIRPQPTTTSRPRARPTRRSQPCSRRKPTHRADRSTSRPNPGAQASRPFHSLPSPPPWGLMPNRLERASMHRKTSLSRWRRRSSRGRPRSEAVRLRFCLAFVAVVSLTIGVHLCVCTCTRLYYVRAPSWHVGAAAADAIMDVTPDPDGDTEGALVVRRTSRIWRTRTRNQRSRSPPVGPTSGAGL